MRRLKIAQITFSVPVIILMCAGYFSLMQIAVSRTFVFQKDVYAQQEPPASGTTLTPQKQKNATPTPTPLKDVISKLKQIEIMKEKIATKVSEIRQGNKSGKEGTVTKIDGKTITVNTIKGEVSIPYSDDTSFFLLDKNSKKDISAQKVKAGDKVSLFGYTEENKNEFSVKYVFVQNPKTVVYGKITDVDKDDYMLTIHDNDKDWNFDIETTTKTSQYDPVKKSLTKAGFSKFTVGQQVIVIAGSKPATESSTVIYGAERIYIIGGGGSTSPTPGTKENKSAGSTGTSVTPSPKSPAKITTTPTPVKKTSSDKLNG